MGCLFILQLNFASERPCLQVFVMHVIKSDCCSFAHSQRIPVAFITTVMIIELVEVEWEICRRPQIFWHNLAVKHVKRMVCIDFLKENHEVHRNVAESTKVLPWNTAQRSCRKIPACSWQLLSQWSGALRSHGYPFSQKMGCQGATKSFLTPWCLQIICSPTVCYLYMLYVEVNNNDPCMRFKGPEWWGFACSHLCPHGPEGPC